MTYRGRARRGQALVRPSRQYAAGAEGSKYVTSTGALVVVEDLKALYKCDFIPILQAPTDPEEVLLPVGNMPPLAQAFLANVTKELALYYRKPIIEDVAAAYTDPRAKKSPHLGPFLEAARGHVLDLVKEVLLKELEDDYIPDESSDDESGGQEGSEATEEYAGAFGHYYTASPAAAASFTSPAGAASSAPGTSPSPVWRSKGTKAAEFVEMAVAAWDKKSGVGVPFFGPKSSEFNLLEFYSDLDLGISKLEGGKQATAAFKVAANLLHGFTAAAAGPERIFSRAGFIVTALRNGLSVWTVELMVFLYKNRAFMPSVEEVVEEILRRAQTKKAAKKAARAAQKGAAAASFSFFFFSSSSSSSSSFLDSSSSLSSAAKTQKADADVGAGGEVGFEEEDPDTEDLVLSESAVESILNDIASFRCAPDDGGGDTDSFLALIDDLETCDSQVECRGRAHSDNW